MQDRPVCWECTNKIETNAEIVFESVCGHDDCPSVVFHPLCLMDWRERRAETIARIQAHWKELFEAWREKQERGTQN